MRALRPIRPPASIEKEYRDKLLKLVKEMDDSLMYWLTAKYRQAESEIVGDGALGDLTTELRKQAEKWRERFKEESATLSTWFATSIRNYVAYNLSNQFRKSGLVKLGFDLKYSYRSQKERMVFQSIVHENVNLITNRLMVDHLTDVEGVIFRNIETGHDLARMREELHKTFGVSERKAKTIARDQTNKATNNLSRRRLLDYGVTKAKWLHTSSGKTYRESHLDMDGQIYSIEEGCLDTDYGDYIQPGELVNCHCCCVPLIGLDKDDDILAEWTEGEKE